MVAFVLSFTSTTSFCRRHENYGLSRKLSQVKRAVPGSIFEDPEGWFKNKVEVLTDKRELTLYHILLVNDSNHYTPDSYLTTATAKLEELKTTIAANGDNIEAFQEVAKEYSGDKTSARNGGFLGQFKRGQLDLHVDDAVFNGDIGQVIGPVRSFYGMHLLWVSDRTEG